MIRSIRKKLHYNLWSNSYSATVESLLLLLPLFKKYLSYHKFLLLFLLCKLNVDIMDVKLYMKIF